MIISHQHRFIFLKTRKTAGTSLEIALSQYCGPNDLITRISSDDEELRRERGFRGPQNYLVGERLVTNHHGAATALAIVGIEKWGSYFKFSIERNPFDRAISSYWWRTRKMSPRPSIHDYLPTIPDLLQSNWHIYSMGDTIAADHVMRFERLEDEVNALQARLGVGPLSMFKAKSGHRTDRRPYREVLSAGDRALIERHCSREIATFRYQW